MIRLHSAALVVWDTVVIGVLVALVSVLRMFDDENRGDPS